MTYVGVVLELREVSLAVGQQNESRALLNEVSFKLPRGHFTAIVGPSGCGKSTLLKVIAGLLEPDSGSVHWDGRDLAEEGDLHPSEIGYVPQFNIAYDHLDVWESVETALSLRVGGLDANERADRTEQILTEVGLNEISDRRVGVLSGGQRRRLALALEMVSSPALLIADEVTSGLDPKAEEEIVTLMHKIATEDRRIVLSVTHSLRHLPLYDSVIVLYQGIVAYHGPAKHLLHYFDVSSPEDVFPRLTRRSARGWHASWQKHRKSYYEAAGFLPASAGTKTDALPAADPKDTPSSTHTKEAPKENGNERRMAGEESVKEEKAKREHGDPEESNVLPGAVSQFFTLLGRRWRIFLRDKPQLLLHLALIFGFPFLVVIFALDGLPAIENMSMTPLRDPLKEAVETVSFTLQATKTASLVSGLIMFQVVLLTLMGANNSAREVASERPIFEKEKLGGVRPGSYVAAKAVFLSVLVLAQAVWMGLFVKMICRFPGEMPVQILLLILTNAAMTMVSLGISSFAKSTEQASLISIYLVGFQLPLSGAVLALPDWIGSLTQPVIAAYWGWSGMVQTMRDTGFYDVVIQMSQTKLSPVGLCAWVLSCHIIIGLFLAYLGCRRSQWD